jgi:hypothetical protein
VGRVEPDVVKPSVGRVIECDEVVAEVHMLAFVDPFGSNAVAALIEEGGVGLAQ